ncbi:glycosyltransferase family 4 protein [Candidatus Saccharibacteria bacterium]|nr:glycosyltransferase family 4 protein [Candidatus Saccharibacteria bacterium]
MKILFDARYIRTDHHDGISRYSLELARALFKLVHTTDDELVFLIHTSAQQKILPKSASVINFHAPTSFKEPLSALLLNRYKFDVVFSPMQTIGSIGKKFSLVLTIHDLIYYRHPTPPHQLAWPIRLGWRLYHVSFLPQRLLLKGATQIVTVSHTTRMQLTDKIGNTTPIKVVHNAAAHFKSKSIVAPSLSSQVNLIYMGSFMPYKNVETLIDSLKFLPQSTTLHLLSRIHPDREKRLRIRAGACSNRLVFHHGVSDREYANLLADQALLVSASLDEGYGIPLAEAHTLGVPVVCSNIAIFNEVAGAGAEYFNPKDPLDIAEKVISAANPDRYRELSAQAKLQSQKFSWQKSAGELYRCLKAAAESHR